MSDKSLLMQRAKAAVIARDYDLAARLFKTLIEQNPDDMDFKIQLGNLFVKSGKDDQALVVFKEIADLKPDNVDILIAIGGIYRRQKRYEESVAMLENALVAAGKDSKVIANVSYNLGFTFRQMGKYDEAIDCFEEVVEKNPRDVLAFNHLGAIHAIQGNHQKAISSYLSGLKIDPNHPVLQFNIARSYTQMGDVKKALSAYEGALRAKPGWLDAIEEYSDLLMKSNKIKEADDVVSGALKINPNDVKMRTKMGNIYNRQSIFDSAEKEFKKALSGDEKFKPALTGLAHSQEKQGKNDDAVKTIKRAAELSPDDEAVMKQSASILLSANYLNAAYEKISELWKRNKDDVQTLNLLGQYYIINGDKAKVEACFDKIDRIQPGYTEVYRDWGARFLQRGDEKDAEDYLKVAVAENPSDANAMVQLAGLYEKQERLKEAGDLYKKAATADPHNRISKNKVEKFKKAQESEEDVSQPLDSNEDFEDSNVEISLGEENQFEETAETEEEPKIEEKKEEERDLPKDSDEQFDFDQFGLENLRWNPMAEKHLLLIPGLF